MDGLTEWDPHGGMLEPAGDLLEPEDEDQELAEDGDNEDQAEEYYAPLGIADFGPATEGDYGPEPAVEEDEGSVPAADAVDQGESLAHSNCLFESHISTFTDDIPHLPQMPRFYADATARKSALLTRRMLFKQLFIHSRA